MRIISGKHRGATLYEFKGQAIRPTSDRAKEAIFNILGSSVKGSRCLDLCCGTGSLGIEAMSRGAESVIFVDNAKASVELTKKNLAKVGEKAEVFFSDALSFLSKTDKKFDLVFIDPPYADDVSVSAVKTIVKRGILNENGIVVFERDKPFEGAEGASVYDVRKYGKAYISLIRKTKKALFAGSFDPLTVGHEEVVKIALKKYDELYVVIMNNDKKTPFFTLDDRLKMLRAVFGNTPEITVDFWGGLLVDYMREKELTYNVRGIRNESDLTYEKVMEEYNTALYPEMVYDYIYTGSTVSSTAVKRTIKEGGSLAGLVSKKISEYVENPDKNEAQNE